MKVMKNLFLILLVGLVFWSSSAFSTIIYNDPSEQEMRDETWDWSFEKIKK